MNPKQLDDIMTDISRGDNAAFEKLYLLTGKGIYTFAYSYMGNREDAEDIMHDAFLQIKRKAYTYTPGTNARAWILQIVKNLALDEFRRRKKEREYNSDFMYENESFCSYPQDGGGALEFMMSTLREEEKNIVILHVFWGYKFREISQIISVPSGTVRWKYSEAIKKLKKYREEER